MAALCSAVVDVASVFDSETPVVVISPAPKEATTAAAAATEHLLTQELARRLYTTQLELDYTRARNLSPTLRTFG